MNIELHIEELLLDGFESKDRIAIGNAVRGELERMLSLKGVPEGIAESNGRSSLNGGTFTVGTGAAPGTIGRQIARSIYQGMKKS